MYTKCTRSLRLNRFNVPYASVHLLTTLRTKSVNSLGVALKDQQPLQMGIPGGYYHKPVFTYVAEAAAEHRILYPEDK